MAKSRPEEISPERMVDPRAGGPNLAEWLNLGSIVPPILAQLPILVPTQEMMPFQRRIRHQHIQISLAVGKRALATGIVPDDEAWKILQITVIHTDTAEKFFALRIVSGLNVNLIAQYILTSVGPNSQRQALFPGSNGETAKTRSVVRTGPVPEAYPRDQVLIADLTATAAAPGAQVDIILSYEIIPVPASDILSEEFVGTEV